MTSARHRFSSGKSTPVLNAQYGASPDQAASRVSAARGTLCTRALLLSPPATELKVLSPNHFDTCMKWTPAKSTANVWRRLV